MSTDHTPDAFRVRLPALFAWDHLDRDLPGGTVICGGGGFVTLDCSLAELREWESDAAYYASAGGPDETPPRLRQSAKAALKIIRALLSETPHA